MYTASAVSDGNIVQRNVTFPPLREDFVLKVDVSENDCQTRKPCSKHNKACFRSMLMHQNMRTSKITFCPKNAKVCPDLFFTSIMPEHFYHIHRHVLWRLEWKLLTIRWVEISTYSSRECLWWCDRDRELSNGGLTPQLHTSTLPMSASLDSSRSRLIWRKHAQKLGQTHRHIVCDTTKMS